MSDLTFPHVFWNKNFEPDSCNHLSIPIQNQKCLKNTKTHPRTTIFPLPFEVQPRLCCLYKCIHRQPKSNLSLPAFLSKHQGRAEVKRIQASQCFFSPFTNFREAGLSETTMSQLLFKWQGENCCPRMRFVAF